MKNATIQLEQVSCPSCVRKIETALGRLEGVEEAKVLFHSSKVKISFDEALLEAGKLEETIHRLGFSVLNSKIS